MVNIYLILIIHVKNSNYNYFITCFITILYLQVEKQGNKIDHFILLMPLFTNAILKK
jgi:hypothetical protein